MDRGERLLKSESARKRRHTTKNIVDKRLCNLYAHLHRNKKKQKKLPKTA